MAGPSDSNGEIGIRAHWSLRLFGGFGLRASSGETVSLPGKRERVLLAYLALSPRLQQPRRKLAALLWGDAADETALDNLRTCVWRLRKALGDAEHRVIISDGEDIVLAAGAFDVDIWKFCRLAASPDLLALDQAADLCTGNLLDGLEIESEDFEAWRRAEAMKYRDQAIAVLTRLMNHLGDAGETERAIRIAQRIVTFDSLHEAAVRSLMLLYKETGRRGAALQLYRSFASALTKELSAEPEPETRLLFKELSQRIDAEGDPALRPFEQERAFGSDTSPVPALRPQSGKDGISGIRVTRMFARVGLGATAAILVLAFALYGHQWLSSAKPISIERLAAQKPAYAAAERDIDSASYEQYLYAQALVRGQIGVFGPQPMRDAATQVEQIVARNPRYAPAWALLAQIHERTPAARLNPGYQFVRNDEETRRIIAESLPKAESAAVRALKLDAGNADAYLALGSVQQSRGKLVEAEDLFLKAFRLDPNNVEVLNRYSALLGEVGRPKEALSMQQHLNALENFVPNMSMSMARFLWLNGKTEAAIEIFKKLPNGRPNNNIARVYAAMGRYSEAAALLAEDAATPNPPEWTEAAARLLLSAPSKSAAPGKLPRLGLTESYIYAYVGAPDRVLEPYEEIAETGYAPGVYIAYISLLWHPAYSNVRQTERFKTFARKAGLVAYWRARGWPEFCHPNEGDGFVCD